MSLKRSPGSVDHHVGSRVKLRRRLIGMSQERLADQIGVAFQQVQKYEKGTNRIGASRLMKIAEVLGVTPGYFFEQDGEAATEGMSGPTMLDGARTLQDFVSTKEGLTLNRAFSKINDPTIRAQIVTLVKSIADAQGETALHAATAEAAE